MRDKGFTLIELLVVVIVLGVLAAIALPTYLNQRQKARDVAVIAQLDSIATELEVLAVEKGEYPSDEFADTQPQGISLWPAAVYDSQLDYDHWGVGEGRCVVHVAHFGQDGLRGHAAHEFYGEKGEIVHIQDDFIKVVDVYPCDEERGAVQ